MKHAERHGELMRRVDNTILAWRKDLKYPLNDKEIDMMHEDMLALLRAVDKESAAAIRQLNADVEEAGAIISRLTIRFDDFTKCQKGYWGNHADAYNILAKGGMRDFQDACAFLTRKEKQG